MMKKRVIDSWITTIIGILMFLASVAFVYIDKMPWYGLIPMGVFSEWFIYATDASFKKAFEKLNLNK